MKKRLIGMALVIIFMVVGIVGVGPASALVRTYYMYLSDTDSGSTTVASGVSTMVLEGSGIARSQGITTLTNTGRPRGTYYVIQLYSATPAPNTGNSSAGTLTVRYKESLYDTTEHWAASGTSNLLSAIPLSGNTRQQVTWSPTSIGNMKFEFVSGATPFSDVILQLRVFSE